MRLYGVWWRLEEHLGLMLLQLLLVMVVVEGRLGCRGSCGRVIVQQQLQTPDVVHSTPQSLHLAHLFLPGGLGDVLSKDGEPLRYLLEGAKVIETVYTLRTTDGILGEGKQ